MGVDVAGTVRAETTEENGAVAEDARRGAVRRTGGIRGRIMSIGVNVRVVGELLFANDMNHQLVRCSGRCDAVSGSWCYKAQNYSAAFVRFTIGGKSDRPASLELELVAPAPWRPENLPLNQREQHAKTRLPNF